MVIREEGDFYKESKLHLLQILPSTQNQSSNIVAEFTVSDLGHVPQSISLLDKTFCRTDLIILLWVHDGES